MLMKILTLSVFADLLLLWALSKYSRSSETSQGSIDTSLRDTRVTDAQRIFDIAIA